MQPASAPRLFAPHLSCLSTLRCTGSSPRPHRQHNPRLRPPLHLFRLSRLLSSHPHYRRQQIPRPNQHSAPRSPLRQLPLGPEMLSSWPRRSARQPCTTPPPHPRVHRSGLQLLITLNVAVEAVTPALKIGLVNTVASVCNIEASLFGPFRPCVAPMLCAHSMLTATIAAGACYSCLNRGGLCCVRYSHHRRRIQRFRERCRLHACHRLRWRSSQHDVCPSSSLFLRPPA